MDDFKRMAVFAAVVQHGSMSAAARALGMSPSAVSQQVRQLEREGGVTLLHRSTRQIALTDTGERYYQQCAAMAQAAAQARAELAAARDEPGGELRLSATVGFARHIAPALGDWLARHPALRLHLAVDDAPIDLIQSRIDLAIRFGRLADSGWAAKRLGAMQWWLCAAPAWAHAQDQAQGIAWRHPARLAGMRWLGLAREGHGQAVRALARHRASAEACSMDIEPHVASNNQLSIQQMCEAGLGLALLGSMDVADALAQGRLERLLPDWDFGELGIWAVTPQRKAQPAKVRQAVDALQLYLARLPGVIGAPMAKSPPERA
ncbi:LysR family transcriptional regulator [Delftia sp. PS-11]|uniref:LysR family transcriptional regulator n=1 Tax=Delftia sp. PS-11 TaxID=2767222 RepID=UPI0024565F77|nr:LysR family transcriptional regulator [Delftia sp. PS-11]KAJ8745289.1 LysR family transcriptional regulator [Delftia sp. PS-11]